MKIKEIEACWRFGMHFCQACNVSNMKRPNREQIVLLGHECEFASAVNENDALVIYLCFMDFRMISVSTCF
jgi:hypothetical protein